MDNFFPTKLISKGWVGNAQWPLKVLWETGCINVDEIDQYSLDAVDANDNRIEKYSLVPLISLWIDFTEELSKVESFAEDGVNVMSITKYHAEYAGECVEYELGVSKSYYRMIKVKDKKVKDNFIENMKLALSWNNILTVQNRRGFRKQARLYLQAYLYIGQH